MEDKIKKEIINKVLESEPGKRLYSLMSGVMDGEADDFVNNYTDEQMKSDSIEVQRIVNYEKKKRNIME